MLESLRRKELQVYDFRFVPVTRCWVSVLPFYPFRALSSAAPFGLPSPVQGSQPGPAE